MFDVVAVLLLKTCNYLTKDFGSSRSQLCQNNIGFRTAHNCLFHGAADYFRGKERSHVFVS